MAMQSKVIDSAQLRETGRNIQQICVEVKKNFDDINSEVQATIGTDAWNGERASHFKNSWDEFTRVFVPVYNSISTISNKAVDAATTVESYSDGRQVM